MQSLRRREENQDLMQNAAYKGAFNNLKTAIINGGRWADRSIHRNENHLGLQTLGSSHSLMHAMPVLAGWLLLSRPEGRDPQAYTANDTYTPEEWMRLMMYLFTSWRNTTGAMLM